MAHRFGFAENPDTLSKIRYNSTRFTTVLQSLVLQSQKDHFQHYTYAQSICLLE